MDDLISRAEAIVRTSKVIKDDMVAHDVKEALKHLPPTEPKRGKWISEDSIFGGAPYRCSECGEITRDTVMGKPRARFCPMCGADMREVTG